MCLIRLLVFLLLLAGAGWLAMSPAVSFDGALASINNAPPAQLPGIPAFTLLSTTTGELEPPTGAEQQSASLIFDVDHDGVTDFVIGSRDGPGPYLVWYQSGPDGWTRFLIEDEEVSMSPSGTHVDVDGDGDRDVVMGSGSDRDRSAGQIWWWENPYPDFDPAEPWTRYSIKTSGFPKHHDMLAGDLDRDGRDELAFWNQYDHALHVAEIPADPKSLTNWPSRRVFTWDRDTIELEGLEIADINLDGWPDLVGAGRWFENVDGATFIPHEVDLDFEYGRVAVGDLLPGGRPEMVMTIGDGAGRIKWFAWDGVRWRGTDLGPVDHGHSLQIVDINNDGHLDIFTAEMRLDSGNPDSGMWFFLGDGQGNFQQVLAAEGFDNHENRVADLDGDGDLDILGKPFNHQTPALHIWVNNGPGLPPAEKAALDRWQRHVIDGDRPWRAIFIDSADLNGDGLRDVVTGGWWYANPGPDSGDAGGEDGADAADTWERRAFGGGLNNMAIVYDFDGDGDADVLGTRGEGSEPNSEFVWAQNDGQGSFTVLDNIQPASGTFLQGVAVDHFVDGQPGVALSWHNDGSAVQLITIPADPAGETWPVSDLSTRGRYEGIAAGDIDGDGLPDLLLGAAWLRGGDWREFTIHRTRGEPDRNLLADINGDGRLDALLGYEATNEPGPLAWYEQGQSPTRRWTEHLIADPPIVAPMSVSAADMDGDGDLDIVAGEHYRARPQDAGLFIFENRSGDGLTWVRHTVYTGDEHHAGAHVADMDNDGDLDILSIGWSHPGVLLYENLSVP